MELKKEEEMGYEKKERYRENHRHVLLQWGREGLYPACLDSHYLFR